MYKKLLHLNLNILDGKYHGAMNVEERDIFMKEQIIYRHLNKSTDIALDMYLIASFCDEPCDFAVCCIWNKDYNIEVFFKVRHRKYQSLCVRLCIHILYQSYTIVCLQLIWSHSVASVHTCWCWVSKMIIYDQPKTLPHMKIYLDKATEACIENYSPPPPKPKHDRVLQLTALSPPPPTENT